MCKYRFGAVIETDFFLRQMGKLFSGPSYA
jgi:hypothetical protein